MERCPVHGSSAPPACVPGRLTLGRTMSRMSDVPCAWAAPGADPARGMGEGGTANNDSYHAISEPNPPEIVAVISTASRVPEFGCGIRRAAPPRCAIHSEPKPKPRALPGPAAARRSSDKMISPMRLIARPIVAPGRVPGASVLHSRSLNREPLRKLVLRTVREATRSALYRRCSICGGALYCLLRARLDFTLAKTGSRTRFIWDARGTRGVRAGCGGALP
jgi:hypothetical protein